MNGQRLACALVVCVAFVSPGSATAAAMLDEVVALPDSPKGGVIVYIGSGDADTLVAVRDAGRFIVQAVLFDRESIDRAREAILAKKAYGPVAVIQGAAGRLPYTDNFVNIVVIDDPAAFTRTGVPATEVARIVTPHGMAMVASDDEVAESIASAMGAKDVRKVGSWTKIIKPRPGEMDEWTHPRHDAEGTTTSLDTVIGVAQSLQFRYGNIWMPMSFNSRTAGGRNYYFGSDNVITCRDSFNGTLLWTLRGQRKPVKLPSQNPTADDYRAWYMSRFFGNQSFTALGNRVYAFVEGIDHMVALDGDTGEVVQYYEEIYGAVGNKGLVHVGENMVFASDSSVASVNRKTGEVNWKNTAYKGCAAILVSGDRVIYSKDSRTRPSKVSTEQNPDLACLNLADGKELWRRQDFSGRVRLAKYGVIGVIGGLYEKQAQPEQVKRMPARIAAYSLKDGSLVWEKKTGYPGPGFDLFGFDGLIWMTNGTAGMDPLTGNVKRTGGTGEQCVLRCVADAAATVNYFYFGRPFGFQEIKTGKHYKSQALRNGCASTPGIFLGNGLLYSFPKQCGCFPMLRGYTGFATHKPLTPMPDDQRLVKGPAYGTVAKESLQDAYSQWRSYLGNERRSSYVNTKITLPLKEVWRVKAEDQIAPEWIDYDWNLNKTVDAPVSAPSAGNGLVAVALPESHRVAVYDTVTGKERWSFVSEARVVVPPTFHGDMALVGSTDGYVYCLRAKDGELIWRYCAAPAQRRIAIFGQVESHWPVTAGVAVQNGNVYFASGRHGDLNHGMTGYKLDACTGRLVWRKPVMLSVSRKRTMTTTQVPVIDNGGIRLAQNGPVYNEEGAYLVEPNENKEWHSNMHPDNHPQGSYSSRKVIMLSAREGLLDHTTGRGDQQGTVKAATYVQTYGNVNGQQIAHNDSMVYRMTGASLTAYDIRRLDRKVPGMRKHERAVYNALPAEERAIIDPQWNNSTGADIRAIGVTEEVVAAATKAGVLAVFDARTGKEVSETKFNGTPARWGLAISGGRIYVSTDQGELICFH